MISCCIHCIPYLLACIEVETSGICKKLLKLHQSGQPDKQHVAMGHFLAWVEQLWQVVNRLACLVATDLFGFQIALYLDSSVKDAIYSWIRVCMDFGKF